MSSQAVSTQYHKKSPLAQFRGADFLAGPLLKEPKVECAAVKLKRKHICRICSYMVLRGAGKTLLSPRSISDSCANPLVPLLPLLMQLRRRARTLAAAQSLCYREPIVQVLLLPRCVIYSYML